MRSPGRSWSRSRERRAVRRPAADQHREAGLAREHGVALRPGPLRVCSEALPSTKTCSRPRRGISTTPIGVPGAIAPVTGTVAAASSAARARCTSRPGRGWPRGRSRRRGSRRRREQPPSRATVPSDQPGPGRLGRGLRSAAGGSASAARGRSGPPPPSTPRAGSAAPSGRGRGRSASSATRGPRLDLREITSSSGPPSQRDQRQHRRTGSGQHALAGRLGGDHREGRSGLGLRLRRRARLGRGLLGRPRDRRRPRAGRRRRAPAARRRTPVGSGCARTGPWGRHVGRRGRPRRPSVGSPSAGRWDRRAPRCGPRST